MYEQHSSPFFTVQSLPWGVQAIIGPANDLMYLVTGSRGAMLVDTGMGIGDLAAQVRQLTDLPLVAVNTHGHPDHAGGNGNFRSPGYFTTTVRTRGSLPSAAPPISAIGTIRASTGWDSMPGRG